MESGGHDVPEEKIIQRYDRALELIKDLVKICDVCYIYDNSGSKPFRIFKKRKEQTYYDECADWNLSVRDVVNRMIRWYICLQNRKPVELGILDSYLERYLPRDMRICYCETYACAEDASMWKALDVMAEVFHMAGEEVAACIDTVFPYKQEQDMLDFIKRLKPSENRMPCG